MELTISMGSDAEDAVTDFLSIIRPGSHLWARPEQAQLLRLLAAGVELLMPDRDSDYHDAQVMAHRLFALSDMWAKP